LNVVEWVGNNDLDAFVKDFTSSGAGVWIANPSNQVQTAGYVTAWEIVINSNPGQELDFMIWRPNVGPGTQTTEYRYLPTLIPL